jgi:F-type H+-transporting ATPase subunit b
MLLEAIAGRRPARRPRPMLRLPSSPSARAGIAAEREAVARRGRQGGQPQRVLQRWRRRAKRPSLIAAAQAEIEIATLRQPRKTMRRKPLNLRWRLPRSCSTGSTVLRFRHFLESWSKALSQMSADFDRGPAIAATKSRHCDWSAQRNRTRHRKGGNQEMPSGGSGRHAKTDIRHRSLLIAGLEIRSAHFVLHNSWRADLERRILKELKSAA